MWLGYLNTDISLSGSRRLLIWAWLNGNGPVHAPEIFFQNIGTGIFLDVDEDAYYTAIDFNGSIPQAVLLLELGTGDLITWPYLVVR